MGSPTRNPSPVFFLYTCRLFPFFIGPFLCHRYQSCSPSSFTYHSQQTHLTTTTFYFPPTSAQVMAALTVPHNPIAENPLLSRYPTTRNAGFPSVSSVDRRKFMILRLGVDGRSPWRARDGACRTLNHAVKSSDEAEARADSKYIDGVCNVPLLTGPQAIERLKMSQENRRSKEQYLAMYSSIFDGIIIDPSTMVIPMDDHMVHRGHGVFDTAAIIDGYLYELDQHLDRFLKSASMARITPPFDRSSIRSILIQTVSASKCRQGSLRYWLSSGPGDFQLSPAGCQNSTLYAVVIQSLTPREQDGVKVITSSIPIKSPQFAVVKSVNYLPNVLSKMEAEERGGYAAIWLDDEGFVAEGPNMNVAFVTSKELIMPSFEKILSGCTAKRVLVLAEKLVREGRLGGVRVGNVTVEEGKMAEEMMLIGSGVLVHPVIQWDDQLIGNGKEGPITQALLDLLLEDMKSGNTAVRVPIPY